MSKMVAHLIMESWTINLTRIVLCLDRTRHMFRVPSSFHSVVKKQSTNSNKHKHQIKQTLIDKYEYVQIDHSFLWLFLKILIYTLFLFW